jgi:hypothetical protein
VGIFSIPWMVIFGEPEPFFTRKKIGINSSSKMLRAVNSEVELKIIIAAKKLCIWCNS